MRIIENIHYDNGTKTFKAGEMTVAQYERFTNDPEETILEILTEFQKDIPVMNAVEMASFMSWLISWSKTPTKTPIQGEVNDFHISKGMFLHYFSQPWRELEYIPMREMLLLLEDLPIILGQKEYDPNRKSERIDGEAIRELKKEI